MTKPFAWKPVVTNTSLLIICHRITYWQRMNTIVISDQFKVPLEVSLNANQAVPPLELIDHLHLCRNMLPVRADFWRYKVRFSTPSCPPTPTWPITLDIVQMDMVVPVENMVRNLRLPCKSPSDWRESLHTSPHPDHYLRPSWYPVHL